MAKIKYYYDTKTLSYKRIELNTFDKFKRTLSFLSASAVIGLIMVIVFFQFFDSPKEKRLKSEIENLVVQYDILSKKMTQIDLVLDDIQQRDDNIYRVIFEADPIPSSIRKAGFGGVNRYKDIRNFNNTELVIEAAKKADKLSKQLYIQSKSFDEVIDLAKNKADMLASIPAIQPIANKDLSRMASGYGYRLHPIYKTRRLHTGMDFTAPQGTPIYATGDGKVAKVRKSRRGYGNHVIIDHGYGYKTLYAHMTKYIVHKGQKVKRGDLIGLVGSTGRSQAPHCHYEVWKDGNRINPINFYYGSLSADEYEALLHAASQENQSLD